MTRLRLIDTNEQPGEEKYQWSLRPDKLSDYIGQKDLLNRLGISIKAARKRGEPIDHVLLYGPPGLGKTTLAHIISNEMASNIICTSGPAIERSGDLMGILTNLQYADVLFIDEIHRLPRPVEEFLYSAMEDFKIDFVVDKGPFAKTIKVNIKHFTLVGATTRAGLLSAPLRDRFGILHHVDFYTTEELSEIIKRSSSILNVPVDEKGALEIGRRSRGTPRIANRLLRRVRDYAEVIGDGSINEEIAIKSLGLEGIDPEGLDGMDKSYLKTIIENYQGGPVGIEAIAATLNEEVDTLQDMVEPFLLKTGYISRSPSGRRVTQKAYQHLGNSGIFVHGSGQIKI
ncbi:Holliday junction branch migration DNA helicase RuvB [Pelotomaculum terephthalicicum JT]|uniref:Holliday junction branch migration DNA helicase RuvB n=1 Tax=Pelotomaculum TaxID=191373 RepID=UPI0009D0942D|nr:MULTISPECIES: Holliday junction branch migration DNA helicase RuvB [Pelotomaculum]MCG9968737.1 Holliday junction branch migration DNA helicase RuvB [Pelotomaculum terephthalicicum JT]OPX86633.1 MAG: Holliday junction ATP-dependent DNA helicase RuvB [Pelotomaculum sp. PtaB.Bin117]